MHVQKFLKDSNIEVRGQPEICKTCASGKMHRKPFQRSTPKTTRIGNLVHVDVCGYMEEDSLEGSRYFLLLTDDYSHYRYVYFLQAKSEVSQCTSNYLIRVEKETGHKLNTLRTVNGLEFVNKQLTEKLFRKGIQHQKTVAYTPEQNGKAKKQNRTIVEAARTMLIAGNLQFHCGLRQ